MKLREEKDLVFIYTSGKETTCATQDWEKIDIFSKQLMLLAGENPTYLNVRYDITLLECILNPADKDDILIKELELLALVNQKYRKSSKSWAIRQAYLNQLSYMKEKPDDNLIEEKI